MSNLFTYTEAAEKLRLSPNTLRCWVCAGRIPYVKLGKAVRFSEEQIEEIISTGVQGAKK